MKEFEKALTLSGFYINRFAEVIIYKCDDNTKLGHINDIKK